VQAELPQLRSEAVSPDGTVTIMFSDIEGSTSLADRLGDKRFMDVLREHNAIIREHVQTHGGYEVKSEGDGFMVAFQSARRAIDCAAAIQHALAARNESAEEPVRVRMGLHSGEVIKEGEDFFGRNVILAARVAAQATGGEILVSSVLKSLVESAGDVLFDEPRSAELKGLSGTHLMYPLVFGAPTPTRNEPAAPATPAPVPGPPATADRTADRPSTVQPVSMRDVRYCTTRDGVRIAYAVQGEGPTIIECQSVVGSFFDRTSSVIGGGYASRIAAGRRVVQYDMRGTGLSQRDVGDLSHEALVLDIEAIADALDLDQFVLLAPAMSGPRAIAFAAEHPERVGALILNGTTAAFASVWPAEVMQGLIGLARSNWPQAAAAIANGLNDPRDDGEAADTIVELYVRSAQGETVAALLDGSYGTDVSPLLAQVKARTLVMHITGDDVIPFAEGEKLAAGVPNAEFVTLDHPTRGLYAGTYADDVGDAIDRFLAAESSQDVQYCATRDGVRIAYTVDGDGPALVICDGVWESGTTANIIDAVYEPVYRGRRVLRYDRRGVGHSSRDVTSFTHEAMVRDLETVVDAAGLERFALFGTTFSAAWAIAYAARHPERVERLILTRGYVKGVDVMSRENLDGIIALIRSNWEMASRMMSDLGTREDAPEFGPIFAANLRESVDAEAAAQWLDDLYESTDVTGLLSQIQAPTLILHRKDETLFPFAGAEAMAAGIHGARLITLRGSGPISIGADADANMQLVIDFLNEDRPATT
jgi:pimeloyl-ACP methyl ester carboxylesterase/class 3 adenylate cyclase